MHAFLKASLNKQYTYTSDAVLITAGYVAEMYHPSSGTTCMLPTMQDDRYDHSLEGSGFMCGGEDITPVLAVCSGAQLMEPGRSISL